MQQASQEQIERAKELLITTRHAAMATVNEDGSPHNTPFLLMYDASLRHIYWGSHPASEHSKNAVRTGQLFVVLYDAIKRGGLYLRAADAQILDGAELEAALAVHNKLRVARGQDTLPITYYTNDSPQRMWSAAITQLWVNGTERGDDGRVTQDIRIEIRAADLLS